MKSEKPKKYTLDELNELVGKVPIIIVYDKYFYHLVSFNFLKKGEDYYDPEDEEYQYSDGSKCNIVAYVEEMPEHIPYLSIKKIFVGQEVKIK